MFITFKGLCRRDLHEINIHVQKNDHYIIKCLKNMAQPLNVGSQKR